MSRDEQRATDARLQDWYDRAACHRLNPLKHCDHNLIGKSIVESLRDGEAVRDASRDLDGRTDVRGNLAIGSPCAGDPRNPVGE
jgi:hypothetical protein